MDWVELAHNIVQQWGFMNVTMKRSLSAERNPSGLTTPWGLLSL
jgi:hypothetical protein